MYSMGGAEQTTTLVAQLSLVRSPSCQLPNKIQHSYSTASISVCSSIALICVLIF